MTDFAIVLLPEKSLRDQINRAKSFVNKKFGDQIFLNDPPHLTLFVGRTNKIAEVEGMLSDIAEQNKKIEIRVKDWFVFSQDLMTKKNTLVITLQDKYRPALQKLQDLVLDKVRPFRAKALPKRYKAVRFQGNLKINLDKFGFPFAGDIWIPHMSICSSDNEVIEEVKRHFEIRLFKGKQALDTIGLMILLDEKPERLSLYKLK